MHAHVCVCVCVLLLLLLLQCLCINVCEDAYVIIYFSEGECFKCVRELSAIY